MSEFLQYGLYLQFNVKVNRIVREHNVTTWWFATFHACSAFNNAGFSLFADSMMPFQKDTVIQMLSVVQFVAGNTLFPVFLRGIVWICSRITKRPSLNNKAFRLLLAEPRHFYTHLYPMKETLVLAI